MLLSCLIGERLSAITFVEDYVQFNFDGHQLTAYVWPLIKSAHETTTETTPNYRDALWRRIGQTVIKTVEEPGERLGVEFADGVILEVSLKEAARLGPEAAMFRGRSSRECEVW